MHMKSIQAKLKEKEIPYTYTEEDGCGSIDFVHRGLSYHIWEYADLDEPVGVDTNLRHAGRSEELEGDYDSILSDHLERFF